MKIPSIITNINDTIAFKYPVSTTTAFFGSINWHLWELFFFQICILLIDVVRQKYIKKDRRKGLSEDREEINTMYQTAVEKEKIQKKE